MASQGAQASASAVAALRRRSGLGQPNHLGTAAAAAAATAQRRSGLGEGREQGAAAVAGQVRERLRVRQHRFHIQLARQLRQLQKT